MDLAAFDEKVFKDIVADFRAFTTPLGLDDVTCIPLSALEGDNVVEKSDRTPWYDGPSLLEFLENVHIGNDHNLKDFRFPVQYVSRPNLDFRGFCGKVVSGVVRVGDEVCALPSGKRSRIKRIVKPYAPSVPTSDKGCAEEAYVDYAFPPQSVTLVLTDEIDVSRGEMLVHPDNLPFVGRTFSTMLVWMDEEAMNDPKKSYYLKQTTNTTRCRIDHIDYKIDVNTMEHSAVTALHLNEIARVAIQTSKPLFFDAYDSNKPTGSFILIDPITNSTAAVGMIIAPVTEKDLHAADALPTIDLRKLDIAPVHHEAVRKVVESLSRQGLDVNLIE